MKYCPKCGKENNENVKFCSSCGASFSEGTTTQATQNVAKNNNEGLGTASLVLGIIGLVLSFTCFLIFPIFIVGPLALIGLILGIVNVAKKGKKFAGIILNVFALIIGGITFVLSAILIAEFFDEASTEGSTLNNKLKNFINEIEDYANDYNVVGTWNCKAFDGEGEKGDYIFTLILNDDNTFTYGEYNNLDNEYLKGNYTYEREDKESIENSTLYYTVTLNANDIHFQDLDDSKNLTTKYEMGINFMDKQAIMINPSTYNMYSCYKK